MKQVFIFLFLLFSISAQAQTFPVKGKRVAIKECGNYAVAPVAKSPHPLAKVKSQLVKQIGLAEYNQVLKYSYTSQWPASIRTAFDCEKREEIHRLVMYKIASYTIGSDYQGAIVRIPYLENKNWKAHVKWSGNVYLDIPERDLIPWTPDIPVLSNNNSKSNTPECMKPYDQDELSDVEAHYYMPSPGDKLKYQVASPFGDTYDFIVTIKQFVASNEDDYKSAQYPVSFDWAMGAPVNSKGQVSISKEGLENATRYINYFKNGDILKLTDASTVFLSSKNWYEPTMTLDRSTVMDMTGKPLKFYKPMEGFEYLPVQVNGNTYQLPVYRYNTAQDGTGSYSVYVQDESSCTLIVKMKLDFEIELKEIIPAKGK